MCEDCFGVVYEKKLLMGDRPGRGRSRWNVESALAYARTGKRVLIACDTDLRKKDIEARFKGHDVEVRIVEAGVMISPLL